jgi:hypothetical protein
MDSRDGKISGRISNPIGHSKSRISEIRNQIHDFGCPIGFNIPSDIFPSLGSYGGKSERERENIIYIHIYMYIYIYIYIGRRKGERRTTYI